MGLRKFKQQPQVCEAPSAALLDCHALQAALHTGSANVRRHAIWQAHLDAATLQVLLQHVHLENDEQVLEALFVALTRADNPVVVVPLMQLLASEDALLRNRALEVLSAYPQQVLAQAPAVWADADADVRIFLVNLLTDVRDPGVIQMLTQVLAQETHVNVVAAALEVLTEVGDASALPVLVQVEQRFAHEPFIAFAAQLAMQRIGHV